MAKTDAINRGITRETIRLMENVYPRAVNDKLGAEPAAARRAP